jgi:hypothetical protein
MSSSSFLAIVREERRRLIPRNQLPPPLFVKGRKEGSQKEK